MLEELTQYITKTYGRQSGYPQAVTINRSNSPYIYHGLYNSSLDLEAFMSKILSVQ